MTLDYAESLLMRTHAVIYAVATLTWSSGGGCCVGPAVGVGDSAVSSAQLPSPLSSQSFEPILHNYWLSYCIGGPLTVAASKGNVLGADGSQQHTNVPILSHLSSEYELEAQFTHTVARR
ncbi:hypothetical protein ON010_g5026 [Phytophthora cinnamomi]|nr:hypothetical protein ON010_g5026 [Phytophthora cinnamomi]